jgi:multiple sugar transport system ATP-binding protein
MAGIVIEGVSKYFKGEKAAVYDLDLEVEDGEFVVVVGPSGCGKTTTLRMLAGFETPTKGSIRIGGKVVNQVPPKDRDLAMVFQNYALFPHMTIEKNLAFGMKIRRTPKSTIKREVEEIAGMLGISALLGRKPGELSGGERQRVALGRALLRRPKVFLLDEPLSNLDAALRAQMRVELKRIHAQYPVTTIYVTHDQVEAMTMADRVALMQGGRLQQIAKPETLYEQPTNVFVASFVGTPKINFLPGKLRRGDAGVDLSFLTCSQRLNGDLGAKLSQLSVEDVTVGFRPEDIRLAPRAAGDLPVVSATVELVEPLGPETNVVARVMDQVITCKFPARTGLAPGDVIELEFDVAQMKLFDKESTNHLN